MPSEFSGAPFPLRIVFGIEAAVRPAALSADCEVDVVVRFVRQDGVDIVFVVRIYLFHRIVCIFNIRCFGRAGDSLSGAGFLFLFEKSAVFRCMLVVHGLILAWQAFTLVVVF